MKRWIILFLAVCGVAMGQTILMKSGDAAPTIYVLMTKITDGTTAPNTITITGVTWYYCEHLEDEVSNADITATPDGMNGAFDDNTMIAMTTGGWYRCDLPAAAVDKGIGKVTTFYVTDGTYEGHALIQLGAPVNAYLSDGNPAVTAQNIEDEVLDAAAADHSDAGSMGQSIEDIKTKTDFLPSVAAGASGGLFIAGTNVANVVIAPSSGTALALTAAGASGHGLAATGSGDGEGFSLTAGLTGNGAEIIGGATGGHGVYSRAVGSGSGMYMSGVGSTGFSAFGNGAYPGMLLTGGNNAAGHGLQVTRGNSGADDLYLTNSDAPTLTATFGVVSSGAISVNPTGTTVAKIVLDSAPSNITDARYAKILYYDADTGKYSGHICISHSTTTIQIFPSLKITPATADTVTIIPEYTYYPQSF